MKLSYSDLCAIHSSIKNRKPSFHSVTTAKIFKCDPRYSENRRSGHFFLLPNNDVEIFKRGQTWKIETLMPIRWSRAFFCSRSTAENVVQVNFARQVDFEAFIFEIGISTIPVIRVPVISCQSKVFTLGDSKLNLSPHTIRAPFWRKKPSTVDFRYCIWFQKDMPCRTSFSTRKLKKQRFRYMRRSPPLPPDIELVNHPMCLIVEYLL